MYAVDHAVRGFVKAISLDLDVSISVQGGKGSEEWEGGRRGRRGRRV